MKASAATLPTNSINSSASSSVKAAYKIKSNIDNMEHSASSSTMAYSSKSSTIPAISLKLLGSATQNGKSPLDLLLANPIQFVKASVMSPVYNRPQTEKFGASSADFESPKWIKSRNNSRVTGTKEYKILPGAPDAAKAKVTVTTSEGSSAPPVKKPIGFSVVINGKDSSPPVVREYKEQMKLEAKINNKAVTDATENGVTKDHQSLTNGDTKMSEIPSADDKSPKLRTKVLTNGDVPKAKTLTNGDVTQKKIKKKLDSDTTAVTEEPVKPSKKRKAEELDGPAAQRPRKDINEKSKQSESSVTRSTRTSSLKTKGFHNRANDCYRNSVLQLICSIPELEEEIAKHNSDKCRITSCVCCFLGELIAEHHYESTSRSRSKTNEVLRGINSRLGKVLPKQFKSMRQEDATEYLHAILHTCKDQLNKRIKDVAEKGKKTPKEEDLKNNPIDKTFDASFPSVLTCPKCGHRSFNRTDLPSLMLLPSIRPSENRQGNAISVKELLDDHFKPERVDATCEKCKFSSGKKFTKQVEVERLPRVLVLNVVRWTSVVMNRGYIKADKIMNRLKYDEKMTMQEKGKTVHYRLISVVAHCGRSLSAGHYISFVKQPDGKWALCNDNFVDETGWDTVARADGMQASILGYQRIE
ncbi:uncharacterized protein H6S33_011278 [Morchella sextelata]|uniref:uncharacterized protein n=1 Tax=Morchella sextelata TaxID=1174677 RepID=UPI001D0486A2|nr:uncharacterized protein H6S33_011278 [Morchella sextelata]KAH0610851.1 hypothetical protein H6S33_011278 [Morchella sextelata]